MEPLLGIVIPTLDEAFFLPELLDDLGALAIPHVVVIADGGSTDATVQLAKARGASVVETPTGRARQMNAGAAELDTPWLLFLHADSRVSPHAARALGDWLADAPSSETTAHFSFCIRGVGLWWRILERGQRLRQRLLGLVYGDQGLLVHRSAFEAAGGFPLQPIFEDVALVRALRTRGPMQELPAALETSPRRFEREGRARSAVRNLALITLYLLGVSPDRLAGWYPARKRSTSDRILLVFAKAPIPGHVKTRMAKELGHTEAVRIYRRLGRLVADNVRHGSYRTVVCYDPPAEQALVAGWLGTSALEFWPQEEGGLGVRLASAFETAFQSASRVCVIGTDAPDVDTTTVHSAFAALDDSDVVMGPAHDGGYYLLALARPTAELFESVPWSTSTVAQRTREKVAQLGLRLTELPLLADVDYAHEVPEALR